ncbi:DUF2254 domain-containing protein [Roseomonas eburnea]|uniref:DUF2254 domain-containing protein n=1 Tax=Neoroseomonas eburnea TaxID=1346889 RepID=A0A9X9XHE1_9PROT|nr:DUF2254 domain-containing protein [Neoroseomonas eburnea]MBR0683127.1 DUF2254 domain-containing protein [Neoroseomonas eburnea]
MPVWLIPIAYMLISLICAIVLPRLEHALAPSFDLGISVSSALAALSAIASGMMALTGIVFSVAFVMLQFSAITYSPRFATRFARDPLLFHALGIFFATFTYSLAATAWVDREGSGMVPTVSWFIAIMLLSLSLLIFTLLVRRLADLQIGNTLRFVGDRGREVIAETFAAAGTSLAAQTPTGADAAEAPPTQTLRFDGSPHYVDRIDTAALVELARRAGGRIVMDCAVGDMVTGGMVLLRVHGGTAPLPEPALRRAIGFGLERTFEQDPKYPIRMLVDIAIKALSPAINDPTTAVQALDQIEDLLRRLALQGLDVGRVRDAGGTLRLVFPTPDWEDYLSLAFDEIRMFGITSIQVLRRLRAALLGLEELLGEHERATPVRRYLEHIDAAIDHSALDEVDRGAARQEDPQGLGLTR